MMPHTQRFPQSTKIGRQKSHRVRLSSVDFWTSYRAGKLRKRKAGKFRDVSYATHADRKCVSVFVKKIIKVSIHIILIST